MGKLLMTVAVSLSLAFCGSPAFAASMEDVFAQSGAGGTSFERMPHWQRVLDAAPAEAAGRPAAWQAEIAALGNWSRAAQMGHVHAWVNAFPYREDADAWGAGDHWETPQEFLARSGDCEGFAILKYFTLRAIGFPARDLRIVVLLDARDNSQHAVLAVRWGGAVWMLDNNQWNVIPADRAPYYLPVYSVNEEDWRVHARVGFIPRPER